MPRLVILLILMLLFPFTALAQSPATVVALQLPAWVERGNVRLAIEPGMVLESGDRITTGANAKLLLRLDEGSQVKLGQNVSMNMEKLVVADESDDSVFTGVLNVLQGAFRFTTGWFGKDNTRDIQIQLGTATIGIRGTDVWGKSSADRDFIVLIEGAIEIQRQGDALIIMDRPLTIYDAPRAESALPVSPVDTDQLSVWASETELDPGKGVLSEDGRYRVYLASYQDATNVGRAELKFQNQGYPAHGHEAELEGLTWIRVGISGFSSYADARYFKESIATRLGISDAWISKQ